MLSVVWNRLRGLVLAILHLVARCLCCGRNKRSRRRDSDNATQLTIATVPNNNPNATQGQEPDTWDDWGPEIVISEKKPVTASDHIEAYRKSLVTRQESQENPPCPDENLFADMAPKIRKQRKVFIGTEEVDANNSAGSRLAPRPEYTDPVLAMGNELEAWTEDGGREMGWSPEEEGSLADLLREQRRLKR